MIGQWLRFGEGAPPADGEALVYLVFHFAPHRMGYEGTLVAAIHRGGILTDQNGSTGPAPYGAFWTSLPRPPAP